MFAFVFFTSPRILELSGSIFLDYLTQRRVLWNGVRIRGKRFEKVFWNEFIRAVFQPLGSISIPLGI